MNAHALMHNDELLKLAHEINERETILDDFRGQVINRLQLSYAEIILQGQCLLKAKAMIPHGQWLDWLAAHCPRVHHRSAQKYMLRAQRADVSNTNSSYLQHLLNDEDKEAAKPATEKTEQWPSDIEGISRFARGLNYFERHPLEKWPEPSLNRLRELWQPYVAKLWPDRFA